MPVANDLNFDVLGATNETLYKNGRIAECRACLCDRFLYFGSQLGRLCHNAHTASATAKGSFYNHFTDKDELAREIAAAIRAEVEALVDATNRDIADPAVRMARAFAVYVRFAHDQPERARAMLRLLAGATLPDLPLNKGVRFDLEAGLASGRFSGLPLQAALLLVMGIVQIGLIHVLEHPGDEAWIASVPLLAGELRGLGVPFEEAQALARAAIHDV